jgi:hypothetical protein
MRGLAFICLVTASLYALIGMAGGIFMGITHDHTLSPAHAHLNLVGWASVALYGLYYHVVPVAATSTLAKIQVTAATIGVLMLAPGIGMSVLGMSPGLAIVGSLITFLSMLLFITVVLRSRASNA